MSDKSQWVEVVADSFNWIPSPTFMVSGKRGQVLYLPEEAAKIGVASGQLKKISRPKGYIISKVAQVVECKSCADRRASLYRVWNRLTEGV